MNFIKRLLTHGVEEVIEKNHLEKRLRASEKLRIKHGVDPTAPDLHLGHAVVLRKLKEFQDLGHKIIFIIGDFTARIGDPSERSTTRPLVSEKQIKENAETYIRQVGKILDIKKTEICFNSEWFSKEGWENVLKIASVFSLKRVLERDDFEKRLKSDAEITVGEILYPLMQAYDSVKIKADVEIGGRDQKFNMLAGRILQRRMDQEEQDIILVPILVGLDGTRKMSKSLGNYIGITEEPDSQYGKIMSIPDNLIAEYFTLLTDFPAEEIKKMESDMVGNEVNPRDIKMKLACEIVKIYHNEAEAEKAQKNFVALFQKKEIPEAIPEIKTKQGSFLADVLVGNRIVSSKSEFRRLILEGAVDIDGKVLKDATYIIEKPIAVKIGKKKFVKIIPE